MPFSLGEMHALLDYCAQIDPQNSAYKQQYAAITSKLAKLPRDLTQTVCALTAAGFKGTAGGVTGATATVA